MQKVAGNDGKWSIQVLSGIFMRRAALIVTGFCTGFYVLWLLVVSGQTALTYHFASRSVFSVVTGVNLSTTEDEVWSLPFQIPETNLIAEKIVLYEGPFLEDGSGREVANTAALLVRNCGQWGIDKAEVILEAGAVQFVFSADTIPAGQAVLVLEKDAKAYGPDAFTGCSGWAEYSYEDWSGREILTLTDINIGTVQVTNSSDKVLTDIRLYYKNYLADPGVFVGGNTYLYVLDCLQPGQSMEIHPNNYASGYSGFVRFALQETE